MRDQSRDEPASKYAFAAYKKFYLLSQGPGVKTWMQFCDSPYYAAFIKFARYAKDIGAINPDLFADWIVKKKTDKLDRWCDDAIYKEYLIQLIYNESAETAVERSFYSMQEWGDQFKLGLDQYLYHCGANRLTFDLTRGAISPWMLYATTTGVQALSELSDEQMAFVMPFVEPDVWTNKMKNQPIELKYVKMACEAAGIP